jgi:predicted NUDIX family NTP pyrophosphohydrolase
MPTSAGILLYRRTARGLEVLLAHPGGPFWRQRDDGAWTIPKGLVDPGESVEDAARREFREEIGRDCAGALVALGSIRQRGGKIVEGFALEGDFDVDALASNTFELEWPPRSGRVATFPEVDRAAWFDLAHARVKMLDAQRELLDRLETLVSAR